MMDHPSHFRTWFALVLLVSLAVRLAAGVALQRSLPSSTRFAFADSESYWIHAQRIVRGEKYQFGSEATRVFRTPGYPVILAGLFWSIGDEDPPAVWARCLGAVLGTAAVAGVMLLAWQLFSPVSALVAGLMAALYPGAIAMSVTVLAEAPFCPLMLLQLWCWTRASTAQRPAGWMPWALAAGLIAAAATLVRPSWLLFTPLSAIAAIGFVKPRLRSLQIGTGLLVGLIIGMGPWWIRNYQVTGQFIPTTLQVGASLYDGLNPRATGASDMWFVDQFLQEQLTVDAASTKPLDSTLEYRVDRSLREAAIDWATAHPGRTLQLAGIKLIRMWNVFPNAAGFQQGWQKLIVALGYVPLLLLGLLGAVQFGRRGWPYLLCVLPAVYFTALHVVFVSSIRYRQPAMLSLLVLGAGFLVYWWQPRRGRETHPDLPAGER